MEIRSECYRVHSEPLRHKSNFQEEGRANPQTRGLIPPFSLMLPSLFSLLCWLQPNQSSPLAVFYTPHFTLLTFHPVPPSASTHPRCSVHLQRLAFGVSRTEAASGRPFSFQNNNSAFVPFESRYLTAVIAEEGSLGRGRDPAPSAVWLGEVAVCDAGLLAVSPVPAHGWRYKDPYRIQFPT